MRKYRIKKYYSSIFGPVLIIQTKYKYLPFYISGLAYYFSILEVLDAINKG